MNSLIHFETIGTGPPLLLIHGYMLSGEMYKPLINEFADDFQLIIPDLRGYGKSNVLSGPYTISQYVKDLKKMIDLLQLKNLHVVGYSKGGIVAQEFVFTHPEIVNTLSLVCTFSHKPVTLTERLQRSLITSVLNRLGTTGLIRTMNRELAETVGKVDPKTLHWYKKMIMNNRKDVMLIGAHELFKYDSRHLLKSIKTPTLVVGAENDIVVPVHHTHVLAQGIPNARVHIVRNAGHAMVHTHTHLFVKYIRNFIKSETAKANNLKIERDVNMNNA